MTCSDSFSANNSTNQNRRRSDGAATQLNAEEAALREYPISFSLPRGSTSLPSLDFLHRSSPQTTPVVRRSTENRTINESRSLDMVLTTINLALEIVDALPTLPIPSSMPPHENDTHAWDMWDGSEASEDDNEDDRMLP